MQKWTKIGLIYNKQNYSSVPVGYFVSKSILRIIFSTRNENNYSIPFSIDFDIKNMEIICENDINLALGKIGTFDENGIMPTSVLKKSNNEIFLYYIGWNIGITVPFRNAIGLAHSFDNGKTFNKYSEGPLLDRSIHDKSFVASNCVLLDQNIYRMYYLSCDKWQKINGVITHYYNIKYAESINGIDWKREGKIAIDYRYKNEYAISVPRVIKENNIYKMWYSYRAGPTADTYRIGYAESENAVDWFRKDEEIDFDVSDKGWDSEMICYPYIFDYGGNRYMLYNGNGYGKTGFGLAILEK